MWNKRRRNRFLYTSRRLRRPSPTLWPALAAIKSSFIASIYLAFAFSVRNSTTNTIWATDSRRAGRTDGCPVSRPSIGLASGSNTRAHDAPGRADDGSVAEASGWPTTDLGRANCSCRQSASSTKHPAPAATRMRLARGGPPAWPMQRRRRRCRRSRAADFGRRQRCIVVRPTDADSIKTCRYCSYCTSNLISARQVRLSGPVARHATRTSSVAAWRDGWTCLPAGTLRFAEARSLATRSGTIRPMTDSCYYIEPYYVACAADGGTAPPPPPLLPHAPDAADADVVQRSVYTVRPMASCRTWMPAGVRLIIARARLFN